MQFYPSSLGGVNHPEKKKLIKENHVSKELTILFMNLDQRFKALLGACQTILTLKERDRNDYQIKAIVRHTFVAPN